MKCKKGKSVLRKEAMERKRRKYFNKIWVAALLLICGGIIAGSIYYVNKDKTSYAADTWVNWDLAKMVEPDNKTEGTSNEQTLTTARATFYDIYSDSQVHNGTSYVDADGLRTISDGNSNGSWTDNANTFSRFNHYLATSKNSNGKQYMDMHVRGKVGEGVYPLYCGLMYPGQTAAQRWGSWSGHGKEYGNWFAHANTNQYDNGSNKMADQGVATSIIGGATQGLVNDKLDNNGNITIGKGDYERVVPFFDSNFLANTYGTGKVTLGSSVSNIAFPFHKGKSGQKVYLTDTTGEAEQEGYYYFDSYHDVIQLNEDKQNVTYYYDEQAVYDTDSKKGFFPYNKYGDANSKLNYVFGVKMEINFNMNSNGKIQGKDIVFEFNGDDDLWVFVDGYLVLDIGGGHIPVHGTINFADKTAVVDKVKPSWSWMTDADTSDGKDYQDMNILASDKGYFTSQTYNFGKNSTDKNAAKLYELLSDTTRNHTLTIFYMERGKSNSNLKIKFNLPQITTLSVGNEVDAQNVNKNLITDDLWEACNKHYFKYQLENKGTDSKDYNNGVLEESTPTARTKFEPIGLDSTYRKKITSEDSAVQRLRFYTFTGTNYYSMVVGGTSVTLPKLKDDHNVASILDENGCAVIDGTEYVFLGWTTDEKYRDNWRKIQYNTYTGTMPQLVSATEITVTENVDYYAVWAKKDLTISYYDETEIDRPLGYDQSMDKELALIGSETIEMSKNVSNLSFWQDSDMDSSLNEAKITRENWKTDSTRKGFYLNGWRLSKTEEEGENLLVSEEYPVSEQYPKGFIPLCDVKLYADWERTCYRAKFQVEAEVEHIKSSSAIEESLNGTWTSNIVYFPIGYSGYLPYMNDTSETTSFLESVSTENGDFTCYEFSTIPIRENYAVSVWTQNDADNSSYRTLNYTDSNGKTLYRQKWTMGTEDAVFTGTWKKMVSTITYSADTDKDGNTVDWDEKKLKYTIGTAISKPEASDIWESPDMDNEWEIVGWKDDSGTEITFPYTITEKDENWTAIWEKVSSKVTYEFADDAKGITGETASGATSYTKYYKVGANIELPLLEGLGEAAPMDATGTIDGTTYYVKGNDGKAYVITGWKYDDGTLVKASDTVSKENCKVTAIWEEVTTRLKVTVKVLTEDKAEWDSDIATAKGWKSEEKSDGTVWTLAIDLIPGEKIVSYFDEKTGSLYEQIYGADIKIEENDLKHFKELSYGTISYPGSTISLNDASAVVPYTSRNRTVSLTGNLVQKKILTTFVSVISDSENTDADGNPLVVENFIGYKIYDVGDSEVELPTETTELFNEDGGKVTLAVPENYQLSGWKNTKEGGTAVTQIPATADNHKTVWYTVWEKKDILTDGSGDTDSGISTQSVSKSVMRALKFVSNTGVYVAFANELYELNDLLTDDEAATGTTGANGEFYLAYDQVASFLNCFTVKSAMHLQEHAAIYNGTTGTESYDEAAYRNMYKSTWELRDLHGYIINREDNTDLKNMNMSTSGATSVYDGRISGEETEAFQFNNENDATGVGYATNVRALFTHTIQTGDLSITKKLTTAAASVAKRKGDTEQEFIFKVYFYHMFGDTDDTEEKLYTGEYKKLNKYGNYVRDENNCIVTYTATDGKILVKNGETAIISGIPVLTEYRIEEEDLVRKSGEYILSQAKEITAKGLAGENKKYAVSDETVSEVQSYLENYGTADVPQYSKSILDNSSKLEGKKLSDLTDEENENIERSFKGKIVTSGYTYNYVATNEVLINGISLYLDKIIDEFYYNENDRFTEELTYNTLTDYAKQTFVFNIKYTPVEDSGDVASGTTVKNFKERLTFDPNDASLEKVSIPSEMQKFISSKQGYKKSGVVIGLEQGYYEISEDELWSWKYDLMGIYETPYGQDESSKTSVYIADSRTASVTDKQNSKKVYRFYIRGKADGTTDEWKTYNGQDYRILDNVEDPTITFINLKATDGREKVLGDTDIAVNKISVPTPIPDPNKYDGIEIDDTEIEHTLVVNETYIFPSVKATTKEGSVVVLSNTAVTWSVKSGSDYVSVLSDGVTLKAIKSGNAIVQGVYTDADGTTQYTTQEIKITVEEPVLFSLKDEKNQGGTYEVLCKLECSSVTSGLSAQNVIDGNTAAGTKNTSMWIASSEAHGPNVYWGLFFVTDTTKTTFCNRKITEVKVFFNGEANCERKIQLYGVSGDSMEGTDAVLTLLGEQTLAANGTSLTFDFADAPKTYKGIKVVMAERTGTNTAPWPAIAEVHITGR